MGVPKFFRYISERYPCLSEFVKEYQIPEFDHLYLDMNGIIHNCSHPDDGDPHFRITEEKIFSDIFHYIEVLFRMIKPQKLFFMAIDGVAPRAKMNQQRGRRFRSAKEAEKLEAKATERGEQLPKETRFDSNCITPGTVFMAKLHEQLKYFIINKMTTDNLWHGCKVILSGHETPGEGEHKIMDYIRYLKAQPGYDPNTRHCLYGLDADLIMLGLCTHEPHFSLLREEVMFGKKSQKRKSAPEQISFYLLHLSLMREYLELEFGPVKEKLPFKFDIESVIDDWVLMSFLVGNDFIPHLPNLHITNGALPMLYNAYMDVLPKLEGFINEGGHLHLDRFEKFMGALDFIDMESFSEHYADLKYFEGKTGRKPNVKERTSYKPKKLEEWKAEEEEDLISFEPLETEKAMNWDLAALIKATDDIFLEPSEENLKNLATEYLEDDTFEEVTSECGTTDTETDLMEIEFLQHKRDYYMNKLAYEQVTPHVLREQAEGYVRAIQWNLNYYYNGVCSWGWYYPHHYAPFISDIKDFKDMKLNFELGKPFKPYEQLLAVLPAASKELLPKCYHTLMTDESSIIKSNYPVNFETDLNGKKQDWEAVVLIPFIDETLLLTAMLECNNNLTPEEVRRNTHGPMLLYEYSDLDQGDYMAPQYFPVIKHHHAVLTPVDPFDIRVPINKLIKGAYPGVKTDVYYPGFPTMRHLKYSSVLEKAKVKVFDQPSRGENMIMHLEPVKCESIEALSRELLGKTVFVGWPHLVEATVVTISNKNYRYHKTSTVGEYNVEEINGHSTQHWDIERGGIVGHYRDRLGIEVGETSILVHAKPMIGRKYIFTQQGRVNLEKQWSEVSAVYPLQTIVRELQVYSKEFSSYKNIDEVFVQGSNCFMLGLPHYGQMGTVMDSRESLLKGRIKMSVTVYDEPNFASVTKLENEIRVNYMSPYAAASKLGISNHLLSRVTGTLLVILGPQRPSAGIQEDLSKVNIGLNLKYNKKNEEIPGYTKKDKGWLYSQKVVELVMEYMTLYPELFQKLNGNMGNDIFYEYELFPEDEGSSETVKEIATWLKKQQYNLVERKSCGSIVLDMDVVTAVEVIVDKYMDTQKMKSVVMQVKPHLLYKPDIQMGNIAPDPSAVFQLYDRVVNIRESYTVPLGYSGTVIAIHRPVSGKPEDTVYDIVFDKKFAGGLSLNCSDNRGYRMSKLCLINRSYGLRLFEMKTGKPGQLLHQSNNQTHKNSSQSNFPSYQQQNSAFASWGMQQNQGRQNAFPSQNYNFPPPRQQQRPLPMMHDNFTQQNNRNPDPRPHPQPAPPIRHTQNFQQMKKTDFMPGFGQKQKQDLSYTKLAPKTEEAKTTEKTCLSSSSWNMVGKGEFKPEVEKGSYTKQLMDLYQENRYGCPRFTYFDAPDGKFFQAQLVIPFSKEAVFGQPATSRELACDNAAQVLLEKLKQKSMEEKVEGAGSFPLNFPTPPKQWCEPENTRPNKQYSPQKSNKIHQNSKNHPKDEKSPSNRFVPLQALVRSHRTNKSGNQNENMPTDKKIENSNDSKGQEQVTVKKEVNQSGSTQNNRRRERKMRIAANFKFAPTTS